MRVQDSACIAVLPSPYNPCAFQLFLSFWHDVRDRFWVVLVREARSVMQRDRCMPQGLFWRQTSALVHTSTTPASLVRQGEHKPAFTFRPPHYFVVVTVFITSARWLSSLCLLRSCPANAYAFFLKHAFSTRMDLCRIRA